MGYICLNEDCFAPDNKKGKDYPVAMECPFCDIPLTQQFNFTEQEQNLIDTLPYVIAHPLKKTIEQTNELKKELKKTNEQTNELKKELKKTNEQTNELK